MNKTTTILAVASILALAAPMTVLAQCVKTEDGSGVQSVELLAGQTILAGTVNVEVVGENLEVTFATTDGWELTEAHLWAGDDLADMPQTKKGNPKIGNFPHKSGDITGSTSHTFQVPLAELEFSCPGEDKSYFIAAHAALRKPDGSGGYQTETGWADGDRFVEKGSWATYFSVVLTCECETTETYPEEGNAYIGYEDWPNGDFDYNDWGMYFTAVETYTWIAGQRYLTKVEMTFTASIYDSGADHYIHISRPIVGDRDVTVGRSVAAYGAETPAGTTSGSGPVDVILFDTEKYGHPEKQIGEVVTVTIEVDDPSSNPYVAPSAPRWDLDDFMGNYDPWMHAILPFDPGTVDWQIVDEQTVASVNGPAAYLDTRLVGLTLPHIIVIPSTDFVPPYESSSISGPRTTTDDYGPYGYFYDFYNDQTHPEWYTEITDSYVGGGALAW
jgi:hypothetical protein